MTLPNQVLPKDQRYWAEPTEDPKEFGKEWAERVGQRGPPSLTALCALARSHYYAALPVSGFGSVASSAELTRADPEGSNYELSVNWLRSNINAQHQVVVAPTLAWTATPINTNSLSLADSDRGSQILEYLWKSTTYGAQCKSAVLGAILDGEEFIFTHWNSTAGEKVSYNSQTGQHLWAGDLEFINLQSGQVARDPYAKSYEQSDWLNGRVHRNKWDLIAQFPDRRDDILKATSNPSVILGFDPETGTRLGNSDLVVVNYFFHKRTPALPSGTQAVILNAETILSYEPLEECYYRLPFHRCKAGEIKGTPWAYTNTWEAMATMDLCTEVQSALATNTIAFGRQMVTYEEGTDFSPLQLGNGPVGVARPKGSPKDSIAPLQLSASAPESFQHLVRLKSDLREIFGLNDISMGQPATAAPNAQAWALLASAAITNNSDLQSEYVSMTASAARSALAIFKAHATYARKMTIVGQHGAAVAKQEEWDKTDFEGISDVQVEVANPLAQTAAGRLEIAKLMIQLGFVTVPEQVEMLLLTGSIQPLTQNLRDELIFIASEGELMLKGINPPVKITDSHAMHIKEHRGVTFSAEARGNESINLAADAHIKAHIQMWLNTDPRILAALGQSAPPPPPPQAAPQGAPSAPQAGKQPPPHGGAGGKPAPRPQFGPPGAPGDQDPASQAMESPLMAGAERTGTQLPQSPVNPLTGQPVDPKTGGMH